MKEQSELRIKEDSNYPTRQDFSTTSNQINNSKEKSRGDQKNIAKKKAIKNHFKNLFSENTNFEHMISKVDLKEENEFEKLISFKDLESYYGANDTDFFNKIVFDILEDKLQLQDIYDEARLTEALKSRFLTGFTMGKEVKETIKKAHFDEFSLNPEQINEILRDKTQTKHMGEKYQ